MDKGAHFFRCDLQVHTPRDRQWNGPSAVTDPERRAYAAELIVACRNQNLNAIAITDHHDMAFLPFIRQAAALESSADPVIVFPAMELTLAVPCQALLIFDATFPDDLFSLALTALAIVPSSASVERTAEVNRLAHLTSLAKVHEELDKHAFLKGKYILLPNVSEGGNATLLRSGYAAHYQAMPCVGGYIDGGVDQLGEGNSRILAGLDSQYGNKPLGLFQTSDNRRRDHADLGRYSTWIKWAQPTAEALRQACLARSSRLSQIEPTLPTSGVTAINVSNSLFLGPVFLELNPQYNALIGGRGTGKSTLLEYIRWGLCDDQAVTGDIDELPTDQLRRRKLVAHTLAPLKGVVQIHLLVNGVPHVVRRNAATNEVALKIGNGGFESCQEADVRALLPIQAYSQKQLSNVGVRVEELRRYVSTPIQLILDDIKRRLNEVAVSMRAAHAKVRAKRQLQRDVANDDRDLRSLVEQTTTLRAELSGVTAADRAILIAQPLHEQEADLVARWEAELKRTRAAITDAQQATSGPPWNGDAAGRSDLPNASLLGEMVVALSDGLKLVRDTLSQCQRDLQALSGPNGPFGRAVSGWSDRHEAFQRTYTEAKARSTTQQVKLDQLTQLEQRTKSIRTTSNLRREQVGQNEESEAILEGARETWCELHEQRAAAISTQCDRLTELSAGQIRATLLTGAGAEEIIERLRSVLTGTNIRKEKLKELGNAVSAADSPIRYVRKVLDELLVLARFDPDNASGEQLDATPLLSAAGFTDGELLKVARKMSEDAWIDLCTVPLNDQPQFEYRVREGEYIPFGDASAGQQATSLLWALLNQEGPPLIIDQPEDDLDNQIVLKIVEQIWKAKQHRQLVFSSHNANVVVNGDADLVACCDYRVTGEQTGGVIRCEGAIDVAEVRAEIAAVMEGGRSAFRLRKEKYGF